LAPDAAWQFLQGLETIHLRAARHSENALKVAKHLKSHPKVKWVRYPGLEGDPSFELAKKYLPNGAGGMVVFGAGGRDKAIKLVDNIKLFSLLANVGDAKSLIIHSSSTTHSQLSGEAQAAGGLHDDLVRLSIGIEHIDDIIEALDDGLKLI
jgi:O-acetylhomoserine (thiol)-lyase